MNKNVIMAGVLFVVLAALSIFLVAKEPNKLVDQQGVGQENFSTPEIIYFYGEGCPYCLIVEAYVEDNNVKDVVVFEEMEVYSNRANANQLVEKAKLCGIPSDSIGVPLLWTGEACLVGDREIIDFFSSKMNQQ